MNLKKCIILQDRSGFPRKRGEIIYRWVLSDMLIAGISFAPSDGNPSAPWSEIVVFGISIRDGDDSCGFDDTRVTQQALYASDYIYRTLVVGIAHVGHDDRDVELQPFTRPTELRLRLGLAAGFI